MTAIQDEVAPNTHLFWSELACHDPGQTPYPLDKRPTVLFPLLVPAWVNIRHAAGDLSISVVSAYRTVLWNAKEGGELNSAHTRGAAIDAHHHYMTCLDFAKIIVKEAKKNGIIRGVGFYPDFGSVHFDVDRQESPLRLWRCVVSYKDGKIVRTYVPWSGEAFE